MCVDECAFIGAHLMLMWTIDIGSDEPPLFAIMSNVMYISSLTAIPINIKAKKRRKDARTLLPLSLEIQIARELPFP